MSVGTSCNVLCCRCLVDKQLLRPQVFSFHTLSPHQQQVLSTLGPMKRNLDENDEPSSFANCNSQDVGNPIALKRKAGPSFDDFDLDPRLLQALAKLQFHKPTLVQQKAIPLGLDMKDVLARAKTGSGKTAAYILPILQSILDMKKVELRTSFSALLESRNTDRTYSQATIENSIASLILVPTRELADQVLKVIGELAIYCSNQIRAVNLADKPSETLQRALLSGFPDVVVSTPTKALTNIQSGALSPEKLSHLVLDEADLVMSYGYEDDLQKIAAVIPSSTQKMLTSATLGSEVDSLKGIFCRNAVLLDLDEPDSEGEGVAQYYTKFVIAFVVQGIESLYN